MALPETHYEVLGTDPQASLCELRAAFKRRALALHPDKGGSKEGFQRALHAFEVLSDDVSRAQYDTDLRRRRAAKRGFASRKKEAPRKKAGLASRNSMPAKARWSPVRKVDTASPRTGGASGRRREAGPPRRPPASPSRAEQKAKARQLEDRLMCKVFTLLQKVSAPHRRGLLQRSFSQAQRLALEAWALAQKPAPAAAAGPGELQLQGGAPALLPQSLCDASPSSPAALRNFEADTWEVGSSAHAEVNAPRHVSVRGIAAFLRRGRVFYQASLCIQSFHMTVRRVPELDRALDVLLLLMSVRNRVGSPEDPEAFAHRLRSAVPEVLAEHGVTAEEIGLRFQVMICMRFWVRPPLHTPQQQCLEVALEAWRRLTCFRSPLGQGARGFARMDLMELEARWLAFREVYLDILEKGGRPREGSRQRLDALEEAARPFRERRLERWNRLAMLREDRPRHQSRKAALAFERSRRTKAPRPSGSGGGRKLPHGEAKQTIPREDRISQKLARLLRRWDHAHQKLLRFESRDRKAAARLAARRKRKQAAASRADARKRRVQQAQKRSAEKNDAKRKKEEHSCRWKWLNRKDITMEELLHFRNMCCHEEVEHFAESASSVHFTRSSQTPSWLKA
ncbi:DNAJ1 [Symbiodinium sp. CCMP2592]|nr:DNAJ1 [Symbiodinium sp. CCMP2592]